jgi:DNA anti-recombination protein RmuC
MFLPNDGIFYYIHVELYDLAEYARSVGVILSSPGTLQPIFATISSFWREYRRNENLQEISKQIKDLKTAFKVFADSWGPFSNSFDQAYERKVKVQEELARLQTKLDKIVKAETEE